MTFQEIISGLIQGKKYAPTNDRGVYLVMAPTCQSCDMPCLSICDVESGHKTPYSLHQYDMEFGEFIEVGGNGNAKPRRNLDYDC